MHMLNAPVKLYEQKYPYLGVNAAYKIPSTTTTTTSHIKMTAKFAVLNSLLPILFYENKSYRNDNFLVAANRVISLNS